MTLKARIVGNPYSSHKFEIGEIVDVYPEPDGCFIAFNEDTHWWIELDDFEEIEESELE